MVTRKKRKPKGHPGFSKKCKALGWSFKKWESHVKKAKKQGSGNPYSIVNSYCARTRVKRRRR